MEANQTLHLQEIVNIADEIIAKLDVLAKDTPIRLAAIPDYAFLDLSWSSMDFEQSLKKVHLSSTLHHDLCKLFEEKAGKLKSSFLTDIARAKSALVGADAEESNKTILSKFGGIVQKLFEAQIKRLHQGMLSFVIKKVRSYQEDVIAKSDFESSGESSVAQKGHSPRAIAILEKVFAQTTNINRSEKLQLARATKLEPRQVTIWFQNRRNRKPTNQANSGINLNKMSSTLIKQRKRKFDDVNDEVPHTPIQRRRMSDSDAASLAFPAHLRHETPFSTSSCERSSSVDLFENSQSAHSNGGTSCGTSYDDCFSSYQNSSPPRSTFGLNSFDDQVVRFTNAKRCGRSGDDKKEMMFNENGDVLLDWDDLELNCEDFKDSVSHAVTSNVTFEADKQYIGASADVVLPNSKQETNDLIMIFARKLVEEQFNAQQGLQQVQQSEGWQSPVFDKIFLAKETEQDVISLAELQSSQSSNPSGPSTSNSTQTSPRSGTPKSLFNFDFETLGLEDSMQYNNESIEQKIDSIDLFAADESIKFDLLTSDALGLFCSSQTASPSTATNDGTSSLTLLQ